MPSSIPDSPRQNRILAALSPEEYARLADDLELVSLPEGQTIDLLMCDLQMPDLDGVELLRHLAERGDPVSPEDLERHDALRLLADWEEQVLAQPPVEEGADAGERGGERGGGEGRFRERARRKRAAAKSAAAKRRPLARSGGSSLRAAQRALTKVMAPWTSVRKISSCTLLSRALEVTTPSNSEPSHTASA